VTGYDIYRDGSTTPLATVPGSKLTYTDTAVVQTTSYSYTVDAFDAAGNHSAKSAPATVNTPDISPPSVPTGLAATTTTMPSVTLTWNASTDNVAVTGYTIYRGGTKLGTVSASTLTYKDTAVAGLTTYSYTVDAFDAAGNHSSQSAPLSVNTPDSTPPSVPTGLTATFVASTPKVDLAWNASADNVGVTGYTIYRNGSVLTTVSGSTLTYSDTAIVISATYVYTVDAFDAAGNHSAQSASAAVNPGVYTAMPPKRLLDTRSNGGKLGPGGSMSLVIAGTNGVPANASAVILNVTAVDESSAGFFTLYPTGATLPTASNLNWVAGETVPNLVSVGLGAGGKVTIYNGLGTADAVVDLEGYFAPSGGGTAGQFVPVVPARITDTRASSGQPNHGMTLIGGTTLNVQVTGVGGIPASGVTAVVLNTTVTDTTSAGFLTVFPTGAGLPVASNLNWIAGVTVPNRVIVPVGTGGKVSFYNGLGSADVIVDVNGYFTDSTGTGASFVPLTPSRIVDTRMGGGAPLGPGATMTVTVAGNGGVPATGAKAVVLNVTVVNPSAASDLIVWPEGAIRPGSSDLNFTAGQTVPNLVVVKLSANGQIDIFNAFGTTNVIVDVVGWYG
jgi:chitodextrinase